MPPPESELAPVAIARQSLAPAPGSAGADARAGGGDPWAEVPAILARIPTVTFRARDYAATAFGARGDGWTDDHPALQRAVDRCAAEGGGRVVVPPGDYRTGPLRLRGGVELHLEAGATLRFDPDSCRYLPPVLTRWEGIECLGLSPLLYAHEESRVAITGGGTLDGQAGPGRWWNWAGPWEDKEPTGWSAGQPDQRPARVRLQQWAEAGVPVPERVVGAGDLLRPMFAQFYRCQDVLVEGVTFLGSPMWVVHPVLSRAVTIRRIHVVSRGPNNDGCVPDSCRDVLIEDCVFDTGDDCVAIKAGRNRDGWRVNRPAENIVVRGCRMEAGHSAVAIGSEISGRIRGVYVERCTLAGPRLDHVVRIKANSTRGGAVEQVHLRDITADQAGEAAVLVDLRYDETVEQGSRWPLVRDLTIERLACRQCGRAVRLEGLPEAAVQGVVLRDCSFAHVDRANVLRHVDGFVADRTVFPATS